MKIKFKNKTTLEVLRILGENNIITTFETINNRPLTVNNEEIEDVIFN